MRRAYRRVSQAEQEPAKEDAGPRLNVLVVISAPVLSADGRSHPVPLDYRAEWQRITGELRSLPVKLTRLVPPAWTALQDALLGRSHDVVHFICHGAPEGLALEDEFGREKFISAPELGRHFSDASVKLAFLNACHSGANMVSPAQAACDAGVPTVIATTSSIRDDAACLFSERLYARLARGDTVSQALGRAKQAVERRFGGQEAKRFTLVGDGDVRLLEVGAVMEGKPVVNDPMPPNNLPHVLSFFGRGQELVRMAELFEDTSTRTILVTGLGGIGKSTTAWEGAYRGRFRFDAIVWSEARGRPPYGLSDLLRDMDLALSLGLEKVPGEAERERLALQYLNQSRCLIVLDNAETISSNHWPKLISFFNRIDPMAGSKVLVTLRPRIPELERMPGAADIHVERLDEESCRRLLLDEAFRRDERIMNALLSEEELIGEVVRHADYHPEMIRLFVGRAAIARLNDALGSIRSLSGTVEERVDEMLRGSLDILGSDARKALGAVVVGSSTKKAIEEICSDGVDVDTALEGLSRASVVEYDPDLHRYHLHQMVSDYVRKTGLVSDGELGEYRRRASHHYLEAARYLDSLLKGETWRRASLFFRLELGNMIAGFNLSVENREWEWVRDYAYVLGTVYDIFGLWAERVEIHKAAVEACRNLGDPKGEGDHLGNLGNAYIRQGRLDKAIQHYEKALQIAREIGDRRGEGADLGNLGDTYRKLKDYPSALACLMVGGAILHDIKSPDEKVVSGNISRLREELSEEAFNKLVEEVGPRADEVVKHLPPAQSA